MKVEFFISGIGSLIFGALFLWGGIHDYKRLDDRDIEDNRPFGTMYSGFMGAFLFLIVAIVLFVRAFQE